MKYRDFGKTGIKVSEISLGTWQLGGKWGDGLNKDIAMNTLNSAVNKGINCFDTADVYQDQYSEITIGEFLKTVEDKPFVITKSGRQLNPHTADGYSEENIRDFINQSRKDLMLMHWIWFYYIVHQQTFIIAQKFLNLWINLKKKA